MQSKHRLYFYWYFLLLKQPLCSACHSYVLPRNGNDTPAPLQA
jgi:hypothetical protein